MTIDPRTFTGKTFEFDWVGYLHTTAVEITIPDLTKLKYKTWGDWGPTYNFTLDRNDPITIKYGRSNAIKSKQKELVFETPMDPTLRKQYPLYLIIRDTEKIFDLNLYIDQYHDLRRVEIVRTHDHVNIFEQDYPSRFDQLADSPLGGLA